MSLKSVTFRRSFVTIRVKLSQMSLTQCSSDLNVDFYRGRARLTTARYTGVR